MSKLIRDGIPERMKADGFVPHIKRVVWGEFDKALLDKLVEEANECRDSGGTLEELADVYEVVQTILLRRNCDWVDLEIAASEKRRKAGGFRDGTFWIDAPPIPQEKELTNLRAVRDAAKAWKETKFEPGEIINVRDEALDAALDSLDEEK